MALNPEDLNVDTFPTGDAILAIGPGGGYCCTGCTSGCGINPTAGGCDSGGGDTIIVAERADIAE